MAKLYFRYGAVGSAKTLNLLAVAHNYRLQSKEVLLIKPQVDERFGVNLVKSRAGLSAEADIVLANGDEAALLDAEGLAGISCVLVDEAQFLTTRQIEMLRELTVRFDVPVICYGLRTDFKSRLFPASQRLFELADSVEEVKTTCFFCNRKAIFNMKHSNGKATMDGPVIDLGCEEKYFPSCFQCYKDAILTATGRNTGKETALFE